MNLGAARRTRPSTSEETRQLADLTMTRDEIASVVAKLDDLDVTDRERRLLREVVRLAGDASAPRTTGASPDVVDVGSF